MYDEWLDISLVIISYLLSPAVGIGPQKTVLVFIVYFDSKYRYLT